MAVSKGDTQLHSRPPQRTEPARAFQAGTPRNAHTNDPNDNQTMNSQDTTLPSNQITQAVARPQPASSPSGQPQDAALLRTRDSSMTQCALRTIQRNTAKVTRQKSSPVRILTLSEIQRIYDSLPDLESHLAMDLVLLGHLRTREACDLAPTDFRRNANGQVLHIFVASRSTEFNTKTRAQMVPVDPLLRDRLLLLLPPTGPKILSRHVYNRLRRIAMSAGIRWSPNILRHSGIHYAIAAGKPYHQVSLTSGFTVQRLRILYLPLVPSADVSKCWKILADVDKLRNLPRRALSTAESPRLRQAGTPRHLNLLP